jgi:hypothetical protein
MTIMKTRTTAMTTALASAVVLAAMTVPSSASGAGTVIRYLSTDPQNTDIDLGTPGLSPGDRQTFINKAVRDGQQIGYEAGEAVIVEVTDKGLKASTTTTLVLSEGTLTLSGVFIEEDFATGPTGLTMAVTGGTGRYRGATGQAVGEFIPGTDTIKTTIALDRHRSVV